MDGWKALAVSASVRLRLWDKGGFLCGTGTGKQPYLLILLNKWARFSLSAGWNPKDRIGRYIMHCKINVLFAHLSRRWHGGEMIGNSWSLHQGATSSFQLLKDIKEYGHTSDFISMGSTDTVMFCANMISATAGGKKKGERNKDSNRKKGKYIKGSIRWRVKEKHCMSKEELREEQ